MSDLIGDCIYQTPFEVIWQEDDSWKESGASRQFSTLEAAQAFFEEIARRPSHRAWLGEIGTASYRSVEREAYFYFDAHRLGKKYSHLQDQLGERKLGLMSFNDEESTDQEGNFVLVKYQPIQESGA